MRLAIISDTHMPRGGRRLPDECVAQLRDCDLIIHAGDLIALSVLEELSALGPKVVAIHGNVDDAAVRSELPERRVVDAERARIGVIHDAGPRGGRLERMRGKFPDADAVVFGHSHIPLHECAADGFQIFNPGSPTERRRAPAHTMGIAWVEAAVVDGALRREVCHSRSFASGESDVARRSVDERHSRRAIGRESDEHLTAKALPAADAARNGAHAAVKFQLVTLGLPH